MTKKQFLSEVNHLEKAILAHYGDSVKNREEFAPTFFVVYEIKDTEKLGISISPLIGNFNSKEKREALRTIARETLKESSIKKILFIALGAEAYVSKQPKEEELSPIPPSQDPNRTEALIISAVSEEGYNIMKMYPIDLNNIEKKLAEKPTITQGSENIHQNLLNEFWEEIKTLKL